MMDVYQQTEQLIKFHFLTFLSESTVIISLIENALQIITGVVPIRHNTSDTYIGMGVKLLKNKNKKLTLGWRGLIPR